MSGDMFRGAFTGLIVLLVIVFGAEWLSSATCGYVCSKYTVNIEKVAK